ncbi:MAG: trypsin-like serine protease [Bacteriovoracaceae bacterium]|nr:trypsin-like serine protease [Bacteriovoracaceae bacterium]
MANYFTIFLLLTLVSCVDHRGKEISGKVKNVIISKIIDGKHDAQNRFKNVAFLRTKNSICSSTIIHPYIALTAAHCVNDAEVTGIILSNSIAVDELNATIRVPVHKVIINSAYAKYAEERIKEAEFRKEERLAAGLEDNLKVSFRGQEKEDIALIILKNKAPIDISSIVPLISLAELEHLNVKADDQVIISGFGKDGAGKVTGNRNFKEITILHDQYCGDMNPNEIWSLEMGAWSGDSGGPAFIMKGNKKRQIGIASTVNVTDTSMRCKRSYYTNVSRHLSWIKEQVGYYPGVDFDMLTQELMEKYILNLPLSNKGTISYELFRIEAAQLVITPTFLKLNNILNSEEEDENRTENEFRINVQLFNCNKAGNDCRKIRTIGSTTLRNNISYKFENFRTSVLISELIFSEGILKYEIEVENGFDKPNKLIGSKVIPVDLRKNFTQKQIDQKRHLLRTTSIMNNELQLSLEIQLIP